MAPAEFSSEGESVDDTELVPRRMALIGECEQVERNIELYADPRKRDGMGVFVPRSGEPFVAIEFAWDEESTTTLAESSAAEIKAIVEDFLDTWWGDIRR